MPLVDIADLSEAALDYAVAVLEGFVISEDSKFGFWLEHPLRTPRCLAQYRATDPEIAYRIIEREGIATRKHSLGTWYAMLSADLGDSESASWAERSYKRSVRYGKLSYETAARTVRFEGQSSLAAAMRCYVAAKCEPVLVGTELVYRVEIPEALIRVAA